MRPIFRLCLATVLLSTGLLATPVRAASAEEKAARREKVLQKLNSLIIKRVEFDNVPLKDAVNFLIDQGREADPEKAGVNIVVDRSVWGDRAPGSAPPAAARAATPEAVAGPTVTLNLRNVSLLSAIKFLSTVCGLTYRVGPEAVVIFPKDAVLRTETRIFNVAPGTFRLPVERDEGSSGLGSGGNRP